MSIRRVVPNIKSAHFDESRKFYTDFLGFDVAMDMGWIVTFTSPNNPTAAVTLLQEPDAVLPHPQISIEVSDIDATYAKAVAGGLEIVHPLTNEPWGVRRFYVVDPNGIVINIMSHGK
jgi:catechol 2,3-dioxygenase-like lactoylglutathione lyase family enzyme